MAMAMQTLSVRPAARQTVRFPSQFRTCWRLIYIEKPLESYGSRLWRCRSASVQYPAIAGLRLLVNAFAMAQVPLLVECPEVAGTGQSGPTPAESGDRALQRHEQSGSRRWGWQHQLDCVV